MPRRLLLLLALFAAIGGVVWLLQQAPPSPPPPPLTDGTDPIAEPTSPSLLSSGGLVVLDDDERAARARLVERRQGALAFVRGVVVDASGRGIPDATVSVRPIDFRSIRGAPYTDGPVLATGRSDRDGAFRLETDAEGWLRVVAEAAGRATVGQRIAGPGVAVHLVLPRAAQLDVTIVDDAGDPVADAAVEARVQETVLRASSNDAGLASLETIPPGTVRLRVGHPTHGTVVAGPYTVRMEERTEVAVVLPRGVPLFGTVRDARTGAPLAGAVVHVAHPGRSESAEPTGPDGRFGPVAGGGVGERVFLATRAEGYAPGLQPVVVGGLDRMEVDVRLEAADPWAGRVVDGRGRGVAGVLVGYTTDGIAGREPAETRTDEQGAFTLPPPPPPAPGRRVVLYAEQGRARAALALRPGSVQPTPLLLTLADGTLVRGRLVDGTGSPRSGVQVRLTPVWDDVQRSNPGPADSLLLLANERGLTGLAAASDENGTWIVPAVPSGSYQVRYHWRGGSRWRDDVLVVAGRETDAGRDVLGDGATVSGEVRDRSGAPVAGAELRLAPEGDGRRAQKLTSDPDGWFAFEGVAPGRYALRASLGSVAPQTETIVVEGSAEQRVDIRFDAGTTLRGEVTTADGNPWSGILRVTIRRDGSVRPDRPPYATRVRGGELLIENLPPGQWLVEVSGPGDLRGEAGPIEVAPGLTSSTRIVLKVVRPLAGVVVTAGGRPSPGATIGLQHVGSGRHLLVSADAQGAFQVEGVTEGTWTADVRGPGGAAVREQIVVDGNAGTRLRFTLAPAGRAIVTVQDERGRPVPQALLVFRLPDGSMATRTAIRTGTEGTAEAPDLPIARLLVTARTLDGRRGVGEVYIVEGKATELVVTVRPGRGG